MTRRDPLLLEGRVVELPGRGETFVRVGPHVPGAPTVLLLHGWLASSDLNFFGAYPSLCARYNVIGIDHRGHGRGLRTEGPFALEAAADDAAAMLAALAAGPVIAVGYSMGGPIALHLAQRHPDLVEGLVLTATALLWRARLADRLRWRLLWPIGTTLRFDSAVWAAVRLINDIGATDELVAAWRPHLIAEAKRLNVTDAIAAGRAISRFDGTAWAPRLDVAASVVVTAKDRLVPPRRQRALAEALGARSFDFEGDHDAFLRQPAAYGTAITAAVDSVAARLQTQAPASVAAAALPSGGDGSRMASWWRAPRRVFLSKTGKARRP